jgi:hypothetical protein
MHVIKIVKVLIKSGSVCIMGQFFICGVLAYKVNVSDDGGGCHENMLEYGFIL